MMRRPIGSVALAAQRGSPLTAPDRLHGAGRPAGLTRLARPSIASSDYAAAVQRALQQSRDGLRLVIYGADRPIVAAVSLEPAADLVRQALGPVGLTMLGVLVLCGLTFVVVRLGADAATAVLRFVREFRRA
jgi:hypothetical protein